MPLSLRFSKLGGILKDKWPPLGHKSQEQLLHPSLDSVVDVEENTKVNMRKKMRNVVDRVASLVGGKDGARIFKRIKSDKPSSKVTPPYLRLKLDQDETFFQELYSYSELATTPSVITTPSGSSVDYTPCTQSSIEEHNTSLRLPKLKSSKALSNLSKSSAFTELSTPDEHLVNVSNLDPTIQFNFHKNNNCTLAMEPPDLTRNVKRGDSASEGSQETPLVVLREGGGSFSHHSDTTSTGHNIININHMNDTLECIDIKGYDNPTETGLSPHHDNGDNLSGQSEVVFKPELESNTTVEVHGLYSSTMYTLKITDLGSEHGTESDCGDSADEERGDNRDSDNDEDDEDEDKNKKRRLAGNPEAQDEGDGDATVCPEFDDHSDEASNSRNDWPTIQKIADKSFIDLLIEALDPTGKISVIDVCIKHRKEGGFHHVVILEVRPSALQHTAHKDTVGFVIRVPAIGTPRRWKAGDAYNLRNEANLMKYLRGRVPVPDIIAFDDTFNNTIGAPYIMMTKLPGRPAYELWYHPMDNSIKHPLQYTDKPPTDIEQKRITFLKSLAQCMAKLGELDFDKIGMPSFDDWDRDQNGLPPIGHHYVWNWTIAPENLDSATAVLEQKAYVRSYDFLSAKLDILWPIQKNGYGNPNSARINAISKILEFIMVIDPLLSSEKSKSDADESYVLRHADLDLQNIFVDDDGHVTGIIDWDNCTTVPRCVGAGSAVPRFLSKDWMPCYDFEERPYLSFSLEHYRGIYAQALHNAGSCDAKYSAKSPLYEAAIDAMISPGGSGIDLVNKLLREIPSLRRVDERNFQIQLGRGWKAGQEHLEEELRNVFAPGLPPSIKGADASSMASVSDDTD